MTITKTLDFVDLKNLPISTYWNKDAQTEYFQGGNFLTRLNLTRHLFVNEIPLYFLSVSLGEPHLKWMRSPFHTLEEYLDVVEHYRTQGRTIERVEFVPINDLNKFHRTYDEEYNEKTHNYTNWVHYFGKSYEYTPNFVFEGLTEEHQERFLPEESRHLLTRNLDNL